MAELRIEQDTLRDTVTINGVRYPRALFEDIAAVPTGDRVIRATFGPDGASAEDVDLSADERRQAPSGAPMEWYTRLATMALEAIEAGPNASLLMNLEGIKEHLRAAKEGKWPTWADIPPSGTPSDWVDANVSGNPTLMQAMKNFAENSPQDDGGKRE